MGSDVFEWSSHRGCVLDRSGDYTVIDCESCGFRHVVPIPGDEELRGAYETEYYGVEKPRYLENARADAEWWGLAYDDRYDTFESELPRARRRLLDVGSGPGLFLQRGAERGWSVSGVEPSAQATEYSRGLGLDVRNAFFDDAIAAEIGPFDVVHMSEVLEHIAQPSAMLDRAIRVLDDGGLLCVLVPNDYGPLQNSMRLAEEHAPWWVAPPHHLNYFDAQSLRRLIEGAGFEVILTEGTFPMELFLMMGWDYTVDDELGRECHSRRMAMELCAARGGLNELRRQAYQALIRLGIGRQVMMVARKPGEA